MGVVTYTNICPFQTCLNVWKKFRACPKKKSDMSEMSENSCPYDVFFRFGTDISDMSKMSEDQDTTNWH